SIPGQPESSWKHLMQVARAADPDELRNRLREARERRNLQALVDLSRSEEVFQHPRLALSLLGRALHSIGQFERAEALLRKARQQHPGDFWANHILAQALYNARPPRLDEAIGFYMAAVALRPQSPGAHVNLGNALLDKGRLEEAIAEYQEAIRLKE